MGFDLIRLYDRPVSAKPKYVCDTVEDLKTLPDVSIGTRAYIVNTGETYASDTGDEWYITKSDGARIAAASDCVSYGSAQE